MKLFLIYIILGLGLSGCMSLPELPVQRLSGNAQAGTGPSGTGLVIGVVADSQLQTRGNYALVRGYRGRLEDWAVRVSIRPPALDWAARAMLRARLAQLAERGVQAVFYLGDGANNGCQDEFAAGFPASPGGGQELGPNDQGLLAILDGFRRSANVPVYFVLGNHDLLGAGSTSRRHRRAAFCADSEGRNRALSKLEVMQLADQFNRGNDRFGSSWDYHSNFQADAAAGSCGANAARQHRRWGCHLAARVNYRGAQDMIQFLLLDTNDWVNVSESSFFGFDQEGLRGAMSFGRARGEVPSQTGWFEQNASDHVRMRVALTHYDVPGLQKHVPLLNRISRQSQRFMNLFSTPGSPRTPNQDDAFVISAHTHNPDHRNEIRPFRVGCRWRGCERRQSLEVRELNIGSTTDYSSYATVVRLVPRSGPEASMYFHRVGTELAACESVYAQIDRHTFPHAFRGVSRGWRALGIDQNDRHNYWEFNLEMMRPMWANLESFAGQDDHRATCIGLFAAALEHPDGPDVRRPSTAGS